MKKITFLISLLLLFFGAIKAQQITNGSFENWTTTGTFTELNGWLSINNSTGSYPTYGTLRTTDAYDGTYALELKSGRFDLTASGWPIVDTAAMAILGPVPTTNNPPNGVPFAFRPSKLTFYYKYQPGATPIGVIDTARVFVDFKKSGNTIGQGQFKIYGNAVGNYTYHEININWNTADVPDTMRMDLTSGLTSINFNSNSNPCHNQFGNTLIIDKMLFDYSSGISENERINNISFYPNPATESVTIDAGAIKINTIKIFNVLGDELKEMKVENAKCTIDVRSFAKGIYLVQIIDKSDKSITKKLIVE